MYECQYSSPAVANRMLPFPSQLGLQFGHFIRVWSGHLLFKEIFPEMKATRAEELKALSCVHLDLKCVFWASEASK